MIRKIIAISLLLIAPLSANSAAFVYGGIKHDITNNTKGASLIVLNNSSNQFQNFDGPDAQELRMPNATTLKAGYWFTINNNATTTGSITVRTNNQFDLASIATSNSVTFYLISNATQQGTWALQRGATPSTGSGSSGAGPRSHLFLYNGNGFGSSATKIRRFTNSDTTGIGSDMTYSDSSTDGAIVTLLTCGIYEAMYCDYRTGATALHGLSINASSLTTNISALSYANGFRGLAYSETNMTSCITRSITIACPASGTDVLRPHSNGTEDNTDITTTFSVTKVSN